MNKKLNNNGLTTTSLRATLMDTATYLPGRRDSLNCVEIRRVATKVRNRLFKLIGHKVTEKCRFTIDHFGIDMIESVATGTLNIADPFNEGQNLAPAAQVSDWSAAINSGQEWLNFQGHYKVAQLLGHPYNMN